MSTAEEVKRFKKDLSDKYGEAIFDKFWDALNSMAFSANYDYSKLKYLKEADMGTRIGDFEKVNKSMVLSEDWLFVKDGTIDDYHKTLNNIDTDKSLSFCMNCKPVCLPASDSKNPTKYNQNEKVCSHYCGKKNYTCEDFLNDKLKNNFIGVTTMLFDGLSEIPFPGLSGLCGKANEIAVKLIETKAKAQRDKSHKNEFLNDVIEFINTIETQEELHETLTGTRATPAATRALSHSTEPLLAVDVGVIKDRYRTLLGEILTKGTIKFTEEGKIIEEGNNTQKKALKAYYLLIYWGVSKWGTVNNEWVLLGDTETPPRLSCVKDNNIYETLRNIYEDEDEVEPGGAPGTVANRRSFFESPGGAVLGTTAGGGKKKSRKKKSKKKKTKKKKSRKNKSRKNKKK